MARRPVWYLTPGLAPGGSHHLSRHLWHRAVPVYLSAWPGPLGHATQHPGVALSCRASRLGWGILALGLVGGRNHAGPVLARGLPSGPSGPRASETRWPVGPDDDYRALLRAAAGALLVALLHAAVCLPSAAGDRCPGRQTPGTAAADRHANGRLLERNGFPRLSRGERREGLSTPPAPGLCRPIPE